MELTEHRFEDLSDLKYRIFTCDLGGKHRTTALVLKFSGVYGIGSEGNGDAEFMRIICDAARSTWIPDAIIFDFRELSYQWGNSIWNLFGKGVRTSIADGLPSALVVSDLCRAGFSSCAGFVPTPFETMESAIAFVSGPAIALVDQRYKEFGLDD